MVSGFAFVQYFPPLWLSTWTVYLHAAGIKCDRSKRLRPQKVNRSASDIKLLSGLQAVSVCWMHWCIWLFHFGSPAYHLGAPNNTFWFNSSSLIIKVTFKLQSNRVTPWSPACPVPAELALSCRYLLIEMSLLPPPGRGNRLSGPVCRIYGYFWGSGSKNVIQYSWLYFISV